jgi:protein-disulfide isomerase
MKKIITLSLLAGIISSCASESQIKETIRKNPKIVFDVIEENPEQFLEVVNKAAKMAQTQQYEKRIAQMKQDQEQDLKDPKKPVLEPQRRLLGNDSGKIIVVEYADFQCPACRAGYPELKAFKEKHKDQVQFYYKNMPLDFHKMAYPAARYFEAIRLQDKNKALKFYDLVFSNQGELSEEFLKSAAAKAGADLRKIEKDKNSDQVKKVIASDMAEFENFGFTGTPTIIVNGVALHGAQPIAELERVAGLTKK